LKYNNSKENNIADELKSLNLIYEETKIQIQRQFDTLTALDTKANITIALAGVLLGIVATRTQSYYISWTWILPVIFLLGSLFCSIWGLWIIGWRSDPSPHGMKSYLTKEEATSKRQFLENLVESYEENRNRINRKVYCFRAATLCIVAGLLTIFFMKLIN